MKVLIVPRRRHKDHTKLAAALALPCSLFLNSQLPVDPPLEVSAGAVINLSCTKSDRKGIFKQKQFIVKSNTLLENIFLKYDLAKSSIHKCIDKGGSWILPGASTCSSVNQVHLMNEERSLFSLFYDNI